MRAPVSSPSGAPPARLHVVERGPMEGQTPALATRVRFQLTGAVLAGVVFPFTWQWDDPWTASLPSAANTAIGVFLAIIVGFYALRRIASFPTIQEIGSVAPVYMTTFGAVIAVFFFSRLDYNRAQLFAGFVLTVAWFLVVLSSARHASRKQFALVPVGEALTIRDMKTATWRVIEPTDALPKPCAGVVVDLRADMPPQWEQFLTQCALSGVPVYHFKHVREAMTGRLEIEHVSENILGAHNPNNGYLKFKRVVDTIVAAVALVVLSPALALVALIIRLDSRGPALYKQTRIAQGGAPFMIYKFRTMHADAAKVGSRQDAMTRDKDPRITRVGGFLRKSRIDELPQILNILKGEMSWIGPRPEAAPLAQWYQSQLPFYQYRHIVPPGITGWAQVNQGHVTDPKHVLGKLHYDFYYIKNFSIWLDILIVLKTLRTILTGFGAR